VFEFRLAEFSASRLFVFTIWQRFYPQHQVGILRSHRVCIFVITIHPAKVFSASGNPAASSQAILVLHNGIAIFNELPHYVDRKAWTNQIIAVEVDNNVLERNHVRSILCDRCVPIRQLVRCVDA
jgi:hypothetical protein